MGLEPALCDVHRSLDWGHTMPRSCHVGLGNLWPLLPEVHSMPAALIQ